MTCTYLVRKNRADKLSPQVFCGKPAIVIYRSPAPDAYGDTIHERCDQHDSEKAESWAATHGWLRENL